MTPPSVQPNTNEVVKQLHTYIQNEKKMDDFTRARLLKDAENQPCLERKYTLKAVIYSLSGEKNTAKQFAVEALKYIEDPATIFNCLCVLFINGFSNTALKQMDMLQSYIEDPVYTDYFARFLTALPNIDYIERSILTIEKANKIEENQHMVKSYLDVLTVVEVAMKSFNLDNSVISKLSNIASSIAESSAVVINNSSISILPDASWVSLVFYVDENDINKVVDINELLVDQLINESLDTLPIVARYEMLPPKADKVSKFYVL